MRVSNSWSLIVENPGMFSKPYSVTHRRIVHRETPNIFEIFCHEKTTPLSSFKVSPRILYFGLPGSPSASLSLLPENIIDDINFCNKVLSKTINIKRYWETKFSQQSLSSLSSETS